MKSGVKKIIFVFVMLFIITLSIGLVLKYKDYADNRIIFEKFSMEEKEGYYAINSVEDYLQFADTVAAGNDYDYCEVILNTDLDFSGRTDIKPIGANDKEVVEFQGIFDGNGHTIKNLTMINPGQASGMFAKLGGIVMNLSLENCSFEGKECGSITATSQVNAVVINCYADVETAGEIHGAIAGDFYGYIFNCVATEKDFTGDLHNGWMEQCYLKSKDSYIRMDTDGSVWDGETVKNNLNAHLPRVGAFHNVFDLYQWEFAKEVRISSEKTEILESLSAKLHIYNEEIELKGYYSQNEDHWCVAVPAGYGLEAMSLSAATNDGNSESFQKAAGEQAILYTKGEYQYHIDFLSSDMADTLYIQLSKDKNLDYIHKNKLEEIPGVITVFEKSGNVEKIALKGIYGHGNDSWMANKKSYNLKLDSRVDLLGMGENEDFALLAGYRDASLMNYVTSTSLTRELGFEYAPEFRLVNLFVEGEYAGVYFLAEKIELDENRIEISNLYESTKRLNNNYLDGYEFVNWKDESNLAERYFYKIPKQPKDLTGGYLLEIDVMDYDANESRFVSERGVKITMKRARCSSEEQVNYMADYWQEFEDALYSPDGMNGLGKHYTEYIDMESFVMQWMMYELVQEGSMSSSIYFYKESEVTGDGLLHACFLWDMEHSYLTYGPMQQMWLRDSQTLSSYWSRFWIHEDFREAVNEAWDHQFVPAIEKMVAETAIESETGAKNLRWYEERIGDLSLMENSRWRKMNPLKRCQSIRDFLNIRKETLSVLLKE